MPHRLMTLRSPADRYAPKASLVLEDENLKNRVKNQIIQNISVAYINDFESLTEENSLLNSLITRNDFHEIQT